MQLIKICNMYIYIIYLVIILYTRGSDYMRTIEIFTNKKNLLFYNKDFYLKISGMIS